MAENLSPRTIGLLMGIAVLLGATAAAAFLRGADIVVTQALFVVAFPVLVAIIVWDLRD